MYTDAAIRLHDKTNANGRDNNYNYNNSNIKATTSGQVTTTSRFMLHSTIKRMRFTAGMR